MTINRREKDSAIEKLGALGSGGDRNVPDKIPVRVRWSDME